MSRKLTERLIRKKRVYSGHAVNFSVDSIRLPNGNRAVREYTDHPGAAAVVPFTSDGEVVLVRQFRYPIGRVTIEIPAGKLDGGELPLRCAKRELTEETGFTAGRIRRLTTFWPAPAFSNETLYIFVADRLRRGCVRLDEDEFVEVVRVHFQKALDWVVSGKIKDSKTIIGLQACALAGYGSKRMRPPGAGRSAVRAR
ncbi:MAG: NUDIX hydrolase [Elusimicrobiota bacterium]